MKNVFEIVIIDSNYCSFLRKYDNRVCYNAGSKKLRHFIGVLFKVKNNEYYAPLSSPKPKHSELKNTLDLIKIENGKLGVINFNNMLPVTKNNYKIIDLNKKTDNISEKHRLELLNKQSRWLNSHSKEIYKKLRLLYNLYIHNKLSDKVKNRCCNFPLLEEKCKIYDIKNEAIKK